MTNDSELERRFLEFRQKYPEAAEYLDLWMAAADLVEVEDPDAAAILQRELPELAG